jgi:signal transduction histidine kinase
VFPLAGVITAGVIWGARWGAIAGLGFGACRIGALAVNAIPLGDIPSGQWAAIVGVTVNYAFAGLLAGLLFRYLRRAEHEVSDARVREAVSLRLHDGVLQVLALVAKRSSDEELAKAAREQERELRDYLFGSTSDDLHDPATSFAQQLRRRGDAFADTFGIAVDVVVAPDLASLDPKKSEAFVGAVGEALTNAGKHAAASVVTVYVEPDDIRGGVVGWVRDDGKGFDTELVKPGVGLSRSIVGRMSDVGGNATFRSSPGSGCEVEIWCPEVDSVR